MHTLSKKYPQIQIFDSDKVSAIQENRKKSKIGAYADSISTIFGVNWAEKGIRLKQETNFPVEDNTTLTVKTDNPVNTTIYLRYPSWSNGASVKVNGKKVRVKQKSGSYIAINRTWNDGDKVSVSYPMSLRIETTPDNPKRGALLYGPIVLAGELGTEGMQAPAPFSNPQLYNDYYTYNYNIPSGLSTTLKINPKHLERSVQRVGDGLQFATEAGDKISPFYDIHRQRYVVYWDLVNE